MPSGRRLIALLLAVLAIAGCNGPLRQGKGKSPLMPAQMSPDSVAIDIFFVRFPMGDSDANEKLWSEVDEQQFSLELRDRLIRNGFRAGLVSGSRPLPTELSKLLQLSDKPASDGEMKTVKLEDLETEPPVVRHHLQLRTGLQSPIMASGIYEQLPIFTRTSGQLSGQPYEQAQCIFELKSLPQRDGRVRLELAPEVQHGLPQQGWEGNQGVLRMRVGRQRRAFDDLNLTADLDPGAMLLVSSLAARPGSLGHYFFTKHNGERLEQKLLIMRVSQTQHDGLFNPPRPIKLEE